MLRCIVANKYGMVLISYIRGSQREEWARRSFEGLTRTNTKGLVKPSLLLSYKDTGFDYKPYVDKWAEKFELVYGEDPEHVIGLDPIFIYSANHMLELWPDRTHIVFLTDDVLYNPEWLQQLDGLIERHPDGKAWTVYRSAYEYHHKTMQICDNGDIEVRSISGIGTISVQEWREYNPDWKIGHGGFYVMSPEGGCTLDLHHAWERKGQRWSTGASYWDHIGMVGTHSNCDQEHANNFVGE